MGLTLTNIHGTFITALRKKYRFPYKGMVSVEDLWDLNIHQLDDVFKAINGEFKRLNEDSLLDEPSKDIEEFQNKVDIIKFIIDTKKAEAEQRRNEAAAARERQRIMEIIADKEDENLRNMSVDELRKML